VRFNQLKLCKRNIDWILLERSLDFRILLNALYAFSRTGTDAAKGDYYVGTEHWNLSTQAFDTFCDYQHRNLNDDNMEMVPAIAANDDGIQFIFQLSHSFSLPC